jgi:hypothetical protein
LDTKFLIAIAISLISLAWLACVIICVIKGKYGTVILGVGAAIAQYVGLPPIGGYYILNLIYPLWLLPVYGALRLAHPESYYAYWFYRRNPAKYFRAVQRFGMEAEYADLVARQVGELTDDEKKHIKAVQHLIDTGTVWKLSGLFRREAEDLIAPGLCKPAPTKDQKPL